ncbi:copper amine oxidase N-terminal domain-containing protein [Paenibacillus wynnii]|uniref:copper amine oxidase N-terminal domain-containing protein n=1 Tax=Paenibacillus wynnii TaxID=268407 RepID=UPI0006918D65|nr:copper amine oxidase N-terminal domain-containing protein [Paenibacillus wynnii]
MKKLFTLLTVLTLSLVLAVPVFSASKPIEVFINNSKVSFNAGTPYLQNGSVLVPFRAVFEKLGLKVLWDAKTGTVTGTGSGLNIQLKIGSNRASINGVIKKLVAAPTSSNGTTYVPLRFIGEATGGTVLWDPAVKSVRITTASSASGEAEIKSLFNNMISYFNEENLGGMNSLAEPESSFYDYASSLEQSFKTFDIKSILNELSIVDLKADEAIVTTTESTLRINGPYIPDQEDQYIYTLIRLNGKWKISDVQLQESTILLTSAQASKPADAPQSDISAINNTLANYYKALNEENITGVMSALTSYDEESDTEVKINLKYFFSNNNVNYTPGISNVYYYNGNEAALYAEQKTKEKDSAETYEQGIIYVFTKASDGTWKIDQAYTVFDKLL